VGGDDLLIEKCIFVLIKNILQYLKFMKFIKRIIDNFLDVSITKGLTLLVTFAGISTVTVYETTKTALNSEIKIRFSHLLVIVIIVVFLIVMVYYIRKKLSNRLMFTEGTEVILSTNVHPIMSSGKYNCLNNKIYCTWVVEKQFKHEWINQNQLRTYKKTERIVPKKNESFWSY
jgi:SNF family Na+-dependent transporter